MISLKYTESITTHKKRVCRMTAKANGWVLNYASTDQLGMDPDDVLRYAWEYTANTLSGQVRDFILLAVDICPKRVKVIDALEYAQARHNENLTDKNWVSGIHSLSDWYCLPLNGCCNYNAIK